jgi:predicted MFS family arabinose efflux permease
VVGPAVAGLTYAAFGPAWCFTLNGISFVAVIAALILMHIQPKLMRPRETSVIQEISEGLSHSMKNSIICTLIALIGVLGLSTTAYITLLPAWTVNILHGGAIINGWLQSARGLGALLGAFTIAALGRFKWKGRLLTIGTIFYPAMLIVFAMINWLPLSLVTLIAVGWGFLIVTNMAGTLLQTLVPEELRGRVTGIYSLVAFGSLPIGGLEAGAVAGWIDLPLTIALGAVVMLLFSIGLYLFVPRLRHVE